MYAAGNPIAALLLFALKVPDASVERPILMPTEGEARVYSAMKPFGEVKAENDAVFSPVSKNFAFVH